MVSSGPFEQVDCEVSVTVFDDNTVVAVDHYCQKGSLTEPVCPTYPSHDKKNNLIGTCIYLVML